MPYILQLNGADIKLNVSNIQPLNLSGIGILHIIMRWHLHLVINMLSKICLDWTFLEGVTKTMVQL